MMFLVKQPKWYGCWFLKTKQNKLCIDQEKATELLYSNINSHLRVKQ